MVDDDVQRDAKLRQLLALIVSRVPADKRVTAAVVQQLLRTKYADDYPAAYIASRESFIADTLAQMTRERVAAAATATPTTTTTTTRSVTPHARKTTSTSESSNSDDEEDSDDDDDDEEESEDEDDEESGDDDDDDDDEDEEEESEEASDDDDDDDAPASKRARADDAFAAATTTTATTTATSTTSTTTSDGDGDAAAALAARCKAMVACLKKLAYRPRLPAPDETLQHYLDDYLVCEFVKRNLDPQRYSADDVRRYKALRELELLQQDGAQLQLDRRARAGRGFAHVELPRDDTLAKRDDNGNNNNSNNSNNSNNINGNGNKATTAYTTAKFLDDVDEA